MANCFKVHHTITEGKHSNCSSRNYIFYSFNCGVKNVKWFKFIDNDVQIYSFIFWFHVLTFNDRRLIKISQLLTWICQFLCCFGGFAPCVFNSIIKQIHILISFISQTNHSFVIMNHHPSSFTWNALFLILTFPF